MYLSAIPSPTCWHCVDPVCVPACPEGAIAKREQDGIVLVDSGVCIGNHDCEAKCLKACPYDAPQFGPEKGAQMRKCHFCIDRWEAGKVPDCVEACPVEPWMQAHWKNWKKSTETQGKRRGSPTRGEPDRRWFLNPSRTLKINDFITKIKSTFY